MEEELLFLPCAAVAVVMWRFLTCGNLQLCMVDGLFKLNICCGLALWYILLHIVLCSIYCCILFFVAYTGLDINEPILNRNHEPCKTGHILLFVKPWNFKPGNVKPWNRG